MRFADKVYQVVKKIPAGKVMTYRHHIPKSDLSAVSLTISASLELKNLGVVAVATMSKFFSESWTRLVKWRALGVRFWNMMSI